MNNPLFPHLMQWTHLVQRELVFALFYRRHLWSADLLETWQDDRQGVKASALVSKVTISTGIAKEYRTRAKLWEVVPMQIAHNSVHSMPPVPTVSLSPIGDRRDFRSRSLRAVRRWRNCQSGYPTSLFSCNTCNTKEASSSVEESLLLFCSFLKGERDG